MKIVQIFPGKVWGGAEQYILDLGRALAARGHEVVYMARPSAAVVGRLEGEVDFTVARFGSPRDRASISQLAGLMADADVVHIHDVSFAPIARRAKELSGSRARIILTRHIARGSSTLPWRRKSVRAIDRIIFVSDLSRRLWLDANSWFPAERCCVVHNSIPDFIAAEADVPDLRRLYSIPVDVPVVMYTGRVRKSKGCGVLVEALAACKSKPWALVLVGACKPADYGDTLMRMAEKAGVADRIHLYGFTPDARSLAAQADIGVMPSIVREAFGLSAVEFMQQGKCVVTTSSGAQSEYITDGRDGLITVPGSVDSLAGALRRVLSDEAFRRSLGEAARKKFNASMSYGHFVDRIIEIYKS